MTFHWANETMEEEFTDSENTDDKRGVNVLTPHLLFEIDYYVHVLNQPLLLLHTIFN